MKRKIAVVMACVMTVSTLLTPQDMAAKTKKAKLSSSKLTITEGKKKTVTIKNAAKAKSIVWKTSKKSVATVKKSGKLGGKITAKKKGKAVISVSFKLSGKKKTLKCNVTVAAQKPSDNTPAPTASATVAPTDTPSVPNKEKPPVRDTSAYEKADILSNSFDENYEPFVTRKNEDQPGAFELTDDGYYDGKALKVTGRVKTWNGAWLDLTDIVQPNATYHVEFWAKQDVNAKNLPDVFYCTTETAVTPTPAEEDMDRKYLIDAGTKVDRNGTWVKVEGNFSVPGSSKHFGLIFETKAQLNDIYLDEFHLDLVSAPAAKVDLVNLQELFKDNFLVGNAIGISEIKDEEIIDYMKNMYGSISMGNEMKPDAILTSTATLAEVGSDEVKDYVIPEGYTEKNVPKLSFANTDYALKTASENGFKMRIHTLLWHQQTPSWFFKEGYAADGQLVSKEVMDKRLEFYVKTVMKHILSSEYADCVYAVDVANEYFHSDDAENGEKYKTYWQKIYGIKSTANKNHEMTDTKPPFVKAAFVYSYDVLKEYNRTEDVKLYYNDYNTYDPGIAERIIEMINWINTKGDGNNDGKLCAGIGMQSHLDITYPTYDSYKEAFDKFVAAGFDIQVTELDITMTGYENGKDATKEKMLAQQAEFYKKLMQLYVDNKDSVSAVVFWGLSDQSSWRKEAHPCLFGDKGIYDVKDAYKAILDVAGAKLPE